MSMDHTSGPFAISLGPGFTPGGAVWNDDSGIPHRRYVKDLLRTGRFTKTSTGDVYEFDADMLKGYAEGTTQYLASGHTIPVTAGHDNSGDPDKSRGYLRSAWVDGDTLLGEVELVGQDAIHAAARAGVSIFSRGITKGNDGKEYHGAIEHVALTTRPVLNGQKPFVGIEASDTAEWLIPVPTKEQQTMNITETLKKKLELSDEPDASALEQAVDALISERNALDTKVTELSEKAEKPAPAKEIKLSDTERGYAKRAMNADVDALVNGGKLTPAAADKLRVSLSDDGHLACDAQGNPNYLGILNAIKSNDHVELGEKTKRQAVELANTSADNGKGYTEDDIQAEIKARANRSGK